MQLSEKLVLSHQLPEQTGLDYNPIKIRTLTDFQSSSDEFILATFSFGDVQTQVNSDFDT